VEGEHATTARIRVVSVREAGLGPGGLIDEGQRVDRGLHPIREPRDILTGLMLYLSERHPFRLSLDYPAGCPSRKSR
jgi:hypothetical protein